MEKLIVTATLANSWIYPDAGNWAESEDDLIRDAVECHRAGAAIIHIHLPRRRESVVVRNIRDHCDAIIQAGMSSDPIECRDGDFEAHPDMLSIILNHHDEHFKALNVNRIHNLEELEGYCLKCREYGIKPEWEVWHTGSFWNLKYLIDHQWVDPPHVLTLFFDWPGGTWTPATADEFLHRVRYMPDHCRYSTSVMSGKQTLISVLSIASGGNVRVGTEDYPFLKEGVIAGSNSDLVRRMVTISREMGREVATSSEARSLLGISG